MATKQHIFNANLPTIRRAVPGPSDSELKDVRCFKYADYDYVYRNCANDYIRYVLDHIPIFGRHKHVLLDVKVHDLKQGQIPCVPGWHLDGSINPKNLPKRPEVFTLFVTGSNARTEFFSEPIRIEVEDSWNFATMSRKCSRFVPQLTLAVWTAGYCQFVTYDDHHFHRGRRATGNEKRLLIRTTETDIITPQNRIYIPYTHA